jgi:hypothetical protein
MSLGDKCSSGCRTKDHATYGECLQDKGATIMAGNSVVGHDYSRSRGFQRRLDKYRALRAQGIQPRTTLQRDIDMAEVASNERGEAYHATKEWDYKPPDKDRVAEVTAPPEATT